MFDNHINKILEFGFAMEDLTLPVNNIFLKIECNIFSYAEIFHCIRHNNPQLIAYPEEMIYPGFAGEDYRGEIKNIDFLCRKSLEEIPFNL